MYLEQGGTEKGRGTVGTFQPPSTMAHVFLREILVGISSYAYCDMRKKMLSLKHHTGGRQGSHLALSVISPSLSATHSPPIASSLGFLQKHKMPQSHCRGWQQGSSFSFFLVSFSFPNTFFLSPPL